MMAAGLRPSVFEWPCHVPDQARGSELTRHKWRIDVGGEPTSVRSQPTSPFGANFLGSVGDSPVAFGGQTFFLGGNPMPVIFETLALNDSQMVVAMLRGGTGTE